MWFKSLFPAILLAIQPALAQSVGTAYRSVTLAPEEIFVEMVLATPTGLLLEQAVALMAPLGLAPKDLKSVGTLREATAQLGWQFCLVRPFATLDDTLKRLEQTRRQLREDGIPLSYQFFLRASPKTIDTARQKVLSELVVEARRNAKSSGKLRSVTIEPTPETVDAGRPSMLFGQASGALQYNFSVVAIFEDE
jgi:hypothetical protein